MCFVQRYSKYHPTENTDKKFKNDRNPAAVLAISWRWTEATFLLIWTNIIFTDSVFWWHHSCFSWRHIHSTIYVLCWRHLHMIINLAGSQCNTDKTNVQLKIANHKHSCLPVDIFSDNSRPKFWIGKNKETAQELVNIATQWRIFHRVFCYVLRKIGIYFTLIMFMLSWSKKYNKSLYPSIF